MTQGFTTQILPFNLSKFKAIEKMMGKGFKNRYAGKLGAMGVEDEVLDALKRRKPKKSYKITGRMGEGLVKAALALEDDEKRSDWQWTDEELLYDQFMSYLEKRDTDTFELANLLTPIYQKKKFPPYRLEFKARGFQGYLSREEARRLLILLGRKNLAQRFANMEGHLPEHPELIHRVECYKRLRVLLRKLVQNGHDALFWVDLERKTHTKDIEDAAEDVAITQKEATESSTLPPPVTTP